MNETSHRVSILTTANRLGTRRLRRLDKARQAGWEALISPHFSTRLIQTLYNIGFLDALKSASQVDAARFAEQHGLDAALLQAVCDALFARSFLKKQGPCYALDAKGRFLVETDLARGWFELTYGYEQILNRLEPLLYQQALYGRDVVRDARYVASGSGLASTGFYFPLIADKIRKRGFRRVLDIGCGDGTFLRYLCAQVPGVRGVGVDLSPDAVAEGNARLGAAGLADRICLYTGNALELARLKPELEGVDAAATFFVLHELCDGKSNELTTQLFRAFRETLPGVPLHIVETLRPPTEELRRHPGMAVEYFLLHDLSGQHPIGRQEWKTLLRGAGFASLAEDYYDFARTSIFTVS